MRNCYEWDGLIPLWMPWEDSRSIADVDVFDVQKFEDLFSIWGRVILNNIFDHVIETIDCRDLLCTSNWEHKLFVSLRDKESVIFQVTLISIPHSIKEVESDSLLHQDMAVGRYPCCELGERFIRHVDVDQSRPLNPFVPQNWSASLDPWSKGDKERIDTISSSSWTQPLIEDLRLAIESGAMESSTQGVANAWIQVVGFFVVLDDDTSRILRVRYWCSDWYRPKPDLSVSVANL